MNAPSISITEGRAPEVLHRARLLVGALTELAPARVDDGTVDLALAEGLSPWLGLRVAQSRATVPQQRAGQLAWEHQMCLASNLVRARVAHAFAERCHAAGIALAWLKGMAMIRGMIDPGARSMTDIDVLVPASRWREACLLAAGMPGANEVSVAGRPYTVSHDYVRGFGLPSGVTLEVHRSVCEASLFAIDHDGLFARAATGADGVSALSEGDLFLTLAAHAAKHTFELPLRSFLDGIVLVQRGHLDLVTLRERARAWRMERALRLWLQCLAALAPSLPSAVDSEPPPLLAGPVWSRTSELVAWQRFARLAWIADRPADWVRHVLTRVAFRLRDAAGG